MSVTPEPWVNSHVKAAYFSLEKSDYPYSVIERERRRRLVSDQRMQKVYASRYLNERLSAEGWRVWFSIAYGAADVAARPGGGDDSLLKMERTKLTKYEEKMRQLDEHLETVVSLLRDIDDMDVAAAETPHGMYSMIALIVASVPSAVNRGDKLSQFDFDFRVLPKLEAIQQDGSRFMPSVQQVVTTLSEEVSVACMLMADAGPHAADPAISAALRTRQHSPTAEFVRLFDSRMLESQTYAGGDDFCMPAELMAILTAVVLDLESVDKKSVTSARA